MAKKSAQTTREEIAYNLGRAAYGTAVKAPAQDASLMAMITPAPLGTKTDTIAILDAWNKGYHEKNEAAVKAWMESKRQIKT